MKLVISKKHPHYQHYKDTFVQAISNRNEERTSQGPYKGKVVEYSDRPLILQHPAVKGVGIDICYLTNNADAFYEDSEVGNNKYYKKYPLPPEIAKLPQYAHAHASSKVVISMAKSYEVDLPGEIGWICFSDQASYDDPVTQIHELAHLITPQGRVASTHSIHWIRNLLELGKQYNMEAATITEASFYKSRPQRCCPALCHIDPVSGKLLRNDDKKEVTARRYKGLYRLKEV